MSNKNVPITDVSNELDAIFTEFMHTSFEDRQKALQAGAEVCKSALENATPRDTGDMAKSWAIKDKYKDRRYVGNTKTVDGKEKKDIPLSNILEYKEGSKHYGFIRNTFDSVESQVFDAIKNNLSSGGN